MNESSVKKLGRNTFYNYVGFGWTALLGFFITPFILRFLGNEQYGIWMIAASTFGFVSYLDLGFNSSIVLHVANRLAQKRQDEVNRIINTTLTIFILLGGAIGACLILFSQPLVHSVLRVSEHQRSLGVAILQIYGFWFMLQMPSKTFDSVLIGLQRIDIYTKISILIRTFERLLVLFLLWQGSGLKFVVFLSLGVNFVQSLISYFLVKRVVPSYRLSFGIQWRDFKKLFSTGIQQFFSEITAAFTGTVDRFLLGSLVHISSVTFYDLATRVSYLIFQLNTRFFLPMYPLSAELVAKKNFDQLESFFLKGLKVAIIITIPCSLFIVLFAKPLIHFWLGEGYLLTSESLRILIISYSLSSLSVIPSAIMYGLNKAWVVVLEGIARIFLNFVLSFILIGKIGLIGASWGLMIATFITTSVFLFVKGKMLHIPIIRIVREVILVPLIAIIGSFFLFKYGTLWDVPKLVTYVIFTPLFLYVSILHYLGKNEVLNVIRRMRDKDNG